MTKPTPAPLVAAEGDGLVAALTFDDGPNGRHTIAILDVLRERGVKAVFAVVGEQIRRPGGPQILQRIVRDGHLLCAHGMTFDDMGDWSPDAVRADIDEFLATLRYGLGGLDAPLYYFRAPNGNWGRTAHIAVEYGMQPLGVVNTIGDWRDQDPELLATRLRQAMKPGQVVLAHDGGGDRSGTAKAFAAVLDERIAEGWRFSFPKGAPVESPGAATVGDAAASAAAVSVTSQQAAEPEPERDPAVEWASEIAAAAQSAPRSEPTPAVRTTRKPKAEVAPEPAEAPVEEPPSEPAEAPADEAETAAIAMPEIPVDAEAATEVEEPTESAEPEEPAAADAGVTEAEPEAEGDVADAPADEPEPAAETEAEAAHEPERAEEPSEADAAVTEAEPEPADALVDEAAEGPHDQDVPEDQDEPEAVPEDAAVETVPEDAAAETDVSTGEIHEVVSLVEHEFDDTALWPGFALRIECGPVTMAPVRERSVPELATSAASLHGPSEYPFPLNWAPGSYDERVAGLATSVWRQRALFTPEEWDLALTVRVDGAIVGVQGARATDFPTLRTAEIYSWLAPAYQGDDVATLMRQAMCAFLFDDLGAVAVTTGVFEDNPLAATRARQVGFAPNGSSVRLRDESVLPHTSYVLVAETLVRPESPVHVEGASEMRVLTGVDGR